MNSLPKPAPPSAQSIRWSTEDVVRRDRANWLREVIGREYTRVEIIPPRAGYLFNEMTIHDMGLLKLSSIRSNALEIARMPDAPVSAQQDAYFAVILLSGQYRLEQAGCQATLNPGDMALYDATRPHRIECPGRFSKLILSIPRRALHERLSGVERCIARPLSGQTGMGAVATTFVRSALSQLSCVEVADRPRLAELSLDLIAAALRPICPRESLSARSRTLQRVKHIIESRLRDPHLSPAMISRTAKVSVRYISRMFEADQTSLMRYVWERRLQRARQDLADRSRTGERISRIAYRWGFSDHAHFSRMFKKRFGTPPSQVTR